MFIGHFAVGLAAKKASPKINLGILFNAAFCPVDDRKWPLSSSLYGAIITQAN